MRTWDNCLCRGFLMAILFLSVALLKGQEAKDWVRFGLDEGLSNLQVNDIEEGVDGFIWLATNEGLRRFDGEFFVNMPVGETSILQNSPINNLAIDDGKIWLAATNRGLYTFDIEDNRFTVIPLAADTGQVKNIHEILIQGDKIYLSLHNVGAIVLDKKNPESYKSTTGVGSVMSTIPISNDTILVSKLGMGLIELSPETNFTIDSFQLALPRSIDQQGYSSYTCEELIIERDGVWLGCWDNALHYLPLSSKSFQSYLLPNENQLSFNSNEIVGITEYDKDLLVATKFGEIFRFDKKTKFFKPFDLRKFKGKKINKLLVANDNRLWVGTDHGLFTLETTPDLFNIYALVNEANEALQVNVIHSINDTVFIGTNEGLYQLVEKEIRKVTPTNDQPSLTRAFAQQPVHSLLDYNQSLFVGTNKTVFEFNGKTKQIKDVFACEIMRPEPNYFIPNDNKFSRYKTMAIQDTEHGKFLWAFAYGHFMSFYHLDDHWGGYTKCYSNYQENLMQRLVVDQQGVMHGLGKRLGYFKGLNTHFVSCDSDAYFEGLPFKKQCAIEFVSLHSEEIWDMENLSLLNSNDFRQLIFHNEDRLLCSSSGLYQMNPQNEINRIPLPYNDIQNALKLNQQLWLISNGRLLNLNLTNHKSKIYTQKNGIPSSGLASAMSQVQNQLVLGGKGFVALADTAKLLNLNPGKFPFLVSSCKSLRSGKSIKTNGQLIENHEREGGLIISFATLTFPNAKDVKYQYRLSSIGNHWIDNGKNNDLVLAGLETGDHAIAVRAVNQSGELITSPQQLKISIQPFWYNTFWFKCLSVFLLLIIVFSTYKIRVAQQNRIVQMRNDISRDLHDDIGSLLGSISIYSESALNQIDTGNKAEAISILSKIGNHARTMIDKMSDIVWSIHSDKDSLEDLSDRMRAYGQSLCSAKNINFNFEIRTNLQDRFDMRERKNIFLIYKEFINNSLKHAGAENIFVAIDSKGNKTFFEFSDDGKGFDQNTFTQGGFGLSTMENRAKDMKGELLVNSKKNKGTKIQLAI